MTRLLLFFLLACKKEEEKVEEIPDGSLILESPAPADFADVGTLKAEGQAIALSAVSVMGEEAELKKDAFSVAIELARGLNVVEAQGIDLRGDTLFVRHGVLAGVFEQPEDKVEKAAVIRLNQSGLDLLCDVVEGALTPELLAESMAGANPVYTQVIDVWGWEAGSVYVDLMGVTFRPLQLDITPEGGELRLSARLPELVVDLYVYGDALGYDLDTTISMGASEVLLDAGLSVGTQNGRLSAALTGVTVEFVGFWYDTSLIPWDLEEYLFVDTLAQTIQDTLQEQILALVPPLIEEVLAGLAPSYETVLLDFPVTMLWEFASASVDNQGLELEMALGVDMDGPSANKVSPGFLGVPKAEPVVSKTDQVAAALSDDLLNRVLFEAWGVGMLDMTLSTSDGSLESYMLLPMHATSGSIVTRADLPPVIIEKDGRIYAQLGEMYVQILLDDSDLGSRLELALMVEVELDLRIEGGVLRVGLGEPDLTMMVRDSDWGASNESTTALVEESLPLDVILALLGELEFELPSLYGVRIEEGSVSRDGSGYFTNIGLGMVSE